MTRHVVAYCVFLVVPERIVLSLCKDEGLLRMRAIDNVEFEILRELYLDADDTLVNSAERADFDNVEEIKL